MTRTDTIPGLEMRFQALSDEKRLRILDLLRRGERCVCELTEELEVGQSLLSFHLKTLREAGLVNDRREGRWVYYSLAAPELAELGERIRGLADGRAISPGARNAEKHEPGGDEAAVYRCC